MSKLNNNQNLKIAKELVKGKKWYEVLNILWELTYDFDSASKKYGFSGYSCKELCSLLTTEYGYSIKYGPLYSFFPVRDIQIGTNNPVIQEIIYTKCDYCISKYIKYKLEREIEKSIYLLKSEKNEKSNGGILSLGFSQQQATFLLKQINTYSVGCLLEELYYKRSGTKGIDNVNTPTAVKLPDIAEITPADTITTDIPEDTSTIKEEAVDTSTTVDTDKGTCSPETLITNSALIMEYFKNCNSLKDLGIEPALLNKQKEQIENLFSICASLKIK